MLAYIEVDEVNGVANILENGFVRHEQFAAINPGQFSAQQTPQ